MFYAIKANKQPLEDLTEMLKTLQGKERIQEHLVRKFRKLARNKGLSSRVINDFPYPMALFEQDGELVLREQGFI